MRKKILSIYLAVAISFLSVVASVIPAYASSSPEWSDYFEITYSSSDTNSPYSLEFKDSKAQIAYKNLSKDERKKIDFDAFSAISAKDQNYKYGSLVFNNTTIPDLIKGIVASSGMVMSGAPDDTGFTADLQDKLTKISNSISASNRKFGGKGISCKASSTHPNNFGLGTLTLSKDFINDLRANIAKFDNYTIYPAMPSEYSYYVQTIQASLSTTALNHLISSFERFNQYGKWVCYYPQFTSKNGSTVVNNCFLFCGSSAGKATNRFFYWKDDCLYCFDFNNGSVGKSKQCDNTFPTYLSSSACNEPTAVGTTYYDVEKPYLLGRLGYYTKIYDSYSDAYNACSQLLGHSTPTCYISTEIVNNDYSTTVNKIYDYSSHDTYTTINNNITQAITDKGSGLTDVEYQKIVDEVMKKVQQEIDSKPDSGDSGGSSGGGSDSGNTGGGSSGGDSGNTGGGESDTWLEKIYNRLGDILEKIGTVTGVDTLVSLVRQIADDIKTLKEGGTLSADLSDTNGFLKDIKKLLGTLIAVQAAGDIADLLTDTVGDKISDFVDNLKSGVSEVTDALQDVFPFSIPWDLMTILALFAAEPEAPVFDIPVHLGKFADQTIHVDLSDFESVSVICRAFLSISFAVGLMYLTIRLTGGEKDDD